MVNDPKEYLTKMKEYEFLYDTKLGKVINKNSDEAKEYIFKILDLLYENYERIRYVDDLSDSVIGENKWAILISQKFAMADKRIPIPQVPFHMKYNGKMGLNMGSKEAYYLLVGLLQESDEEVCVALNFKDEEYRKPYKAMVKDGLVK